ncbi:DegV family protein [Patescibacteria group bacterium]|nr:DegV family protein [Patescibacteria group bacterium]
MNPERKVAVVTDSGASIRPEDLMAKENNVTIVPLDLKFFENGQYVSYSDLDIDSQEFYRRMREGKKLPQTSGAVPGRILETFRQISEKAQSIISIHITSKHSVVWESAILGKKLFQEDAKKATPIEVVDSKQVSLATWFPAEDAAHLSEKGATLEQIMDELKERMPKISLYAVLESFDNLKLGGRAEDLVKGYLASLLSIYPVLTFVEGKLTQTARARTAQKAREKMVEMVADAGKLVKLVVLHTNALETAKNVKEALNKVYKGTIPIHEAGPVLAVHAGEGTVGVAFQKA